MQSQAEDNISHFAICTSRLTSLPSQHVNSNTVVARDVTADALMMGLSWLHRFSTLPYLCVWLSGQLWFQTCCPVYKDDKDMSHKAW